MTRPSIEQQVTFLYTRNLAKTSHFYEDLMGLSLILDQGSCRIYRVAANAFLGFCERESAPAQPQGIIFTFATSQVDAWFEYLSARSNSLLRAFSITRLFKSPVSGS